jgi:geranylgeranyl reductase family protein
MVETSRSYDVIVVGAGPAGSTAARNLAAGGLRVALFDKARLPRYKTCGGGLLPRTFAALPAGFIAPVEAACMEAKLCLHDPSAVYSTVRDVAVVSMVMRDAFDHLLAQTAQSSGATLMDGVAVQNVSVGQGNVRIETSSGEFSARFIVAADGVNSVVARRVGLPNLHRVAPALECECAVTEEVYARYAGAARFDFGITPCGYGWVFPKRNHLSIGVLSTRARSCNLNVEYERYVAALSLGPPLTQEKHGFMIPLAPRKRLFSLPRVLLVGDAAGLADPVTAEGISAAVLSGAAAAEAILDGCLEAGRVSGLYRNKLRPITSELRIARFLALCLYDFPRLRGWVMARRGQQLAEFMTDVVISRRRYADLLRLRFRS